MSIERGFLPLLLILVLVGPVPAAAVEPLAPEESSALKIRCAVYPGDAVAEAAGRQREQAAPAAARPQAAPPASARGASEGDPMIAAPPAPAPTAWAEPTPQQLLARLAPSVFVTVAFESFDAVRSGKAMAIGAAVAIDRRTLVTSCDVVDGSGMISLGTDDAMIGPVRRVKGDPERDRCILETTGGLELPAISDMRGVDGLAVGERVSTIGTPTGLERTLSAAVIAALRPGGSPRGRIQFTAPIAPGSSGGGLFDAYGGLIGVTTFVADGQNRTVAVAIDGIGTLVPRDTGLRAVAN